MSSDSWNLSSFRNMQRGMAGFSFTCLGRRTRAFQVGFADVCIWQDIEFWLFRVVDLGTWCVRCARGGGMLAMQLGPGTGNAAFRGTEKSSWAPGYVRACCESMG
jgi:hypothetical protein